MTTTDTRATLDAQGVRVWLELAGIEIRAQRRHLTELDAAIGDADHGTNLDRGFSAVRALLGEHTGDESPGEVLSAAGTTLGRVVGGASGALWGVALGRAGDALGDADELDAAALHEALRAALDGVVELGAARTGDATMVCALQPAVTALAERARAGRSLLEGTAAALRAAQRGMRATAPIRALKGRASYLGDRSIGHQDPGATSTTIIVGALHDAVLSRPHTPRAARLRAAAVG